MNGAFNYAFALCLFQLLFFTLRCRAFDYEVRGTLHVTNLFHDGRVFTNRSLAFLVSVKDAQWIIKQFNNLTDQKSFFLTGCDGTNVYSVFYDPGFVRDVPGEINSGGYPFDSYPYTTIPWFAFASSQYLDAHTNRIQIAPWTWARITAQASLFRCEIERFSREPRLPSVARFFASEELRKSFLTNTALPLLAVERKHYARPDFKPYTNNFLGGVFMVISKTNFNGLEIPLECEFLVNSPGFKSYGLKYSLRVQGISQCSIGSFLPPITLPVSVADMRFRDGQLGVDGISYFVTNSWPIHTNHQMIALFQKKREEARENLGPPTFWKSGRLQVTFLVVLLLYPAVMVGWQWYRKLKKST